MKVAEGEGRVRSVGALKTQDETKPTKDRRKREESSGETGVDPSPAEQKVTPLLCTRREGLPDQRTKTRPLGRDVPV